MRHDVICMLFQGEQLRLKFDMTSMFCQMLSQDCLILGLSQRRGIDLLGCDACQSPMRKTTRDMRRTNGMDGVGSSTGITW